MRAEVVVAILLVTAAGGCRGAAKPRGQPPIRLAPGFYACPGEAPTLVLHGIFYPPTYPDRPPAKRRPARCFRTSKEALLAGFRRAVTPANDLRIGDLYLVPAERALTRFCRVGAARAHIPVPCPTRVPAPSGSVIDCGGATPCATAGRFVLEGDFTGPLGYVGAGNGAGHLWFLAATPRNRELIECAGAQPLSGRVSILGRRARWLRCPAGSELNSGHLLLEWRRENVVYVVSVHGVTPLNRRLTVALARQVRFVQ